MAGPFTPQQQVLIEIANETASFLGHHHHHHDDHHGDSHGHGHGADHHIQQQIPTKLNTNLGLFALKKLNAIDPTILKVREARLLQPVTPGPITYFINAGFYIMTGCYGAYLWRTRGIRGFATIAVAPLLALYAGRYLTNQGLSFIREGQYALKRRRLVQEYTAKFGESYLLSILNPAFRP